MYKSCKNPGEPSTAALLVNASGHPDFSILSANPKQSWLPERDNRIPPLPVTCQGQAPSGLPPYTGHSLTGERLMGERLLDGSQPFSGNFVALLYGYSFTILDTLPLVPSRRGRGNTIASPLSKGSGRKSEKVSNDLQIEHHPVTGVTPQFFNILVTPDTDPGPTPGYRIKSGMTRGA